MRNGASWMAEDKKDSRRAVSFRRKRERKKIGERGKGIKSERAREAREERKES